MLTTISQATDRLVFNLQIDPPTTNREIPYLQDLLIMLPGRD
jgi:hypothetical protein